MTANADERTPLQAVQAPADRAEAMRKKRLAIGFLAAAALLLGAVTALLWHRAVEQLLPLGTGGADRDGFFCGLTNFETGYVAIANKKDDHYFYWYVESSSTEPGKDPLVLWLTGGPGAPSTLALFGENGPCLVQPDVSTKRNPYAWNNAANVIWLDQPTNVGFSYGAPEDADSNEENVGENIFWFLQGFFDKHPELVDRDFYITGESYGGHYVPAAAHYMWEQNKLQKHKNINLKGIAIGNGLINPTIQNPHYIDMVDNQYNVTFVNATQLTAMRTAAPECARRMQAAGNNVTELLDAESFCEVNLDMPMDVAKRNVYDIREVCDKDPVSDCVPSGHILQYLERPGVRELLNVSKQANTWQMVNLEVNMAFRVSGDTEISYSSYVADLLNADMRVLIYAGDADMACNWYGNQAWTKALEWDGKEEFNAAKERAYITAAGVNAGVVRSHDKRFTFLRVFNSGHMVPQDQPEVALDMITKFFRDQAL